MPRLARKPQPCDAVICTRLTSREAEMLLRIARESGFDTVSQFLRYVIRRLVLRPAQHARPQRA